MNRISQKEEPAYKKLRNKFLKELAIIRSRKKDLEIAYQNDKKRRSITIKDLSLYTTAFDRLDRREKNLLKNFPKEIIKNPQKESPILKMFEKLRNDMKQKQPHS